MFLLELLVNNDTSHSMQRSATIDLRFPALSFLFGLGRGRVELEQRAENAENIFVEEVRRAG